VTPFTPDNKVDLDTFARVIEFLVAQNAASLCINLHLAESLNLTLDERKLLAEAAVEVTAGRVPVIVHVSMPGTDHAVDLARHAEAAGADCVIAIAPYYWKPSQAALYEHFSAIMSATGLPFIAYSSPTIMDGIGIAPATLVKLIERFPKFIGLKEASHNWEKYLELGRAAKKVRPDFGLFVGTEWMIPCLILGGTACMSIFGGIAPRFVHALYTATTGGRTAIQVFRALSDRQGRISGADQSDVGDHGAAGGFAAAAEPSAFAGGKKGNQEHARNARAVRHRTAWLVAVRLLRLRREIAKPQTT
jgi:4-hydroxy-tetrahydrodipicolinate synthase